MDLKKKNCCHYLFFSVKDNQFFIMVIDENKNEAITILPLHYASWQISDSLLTQTKLFTEFYLSILPFVYDSNEDIKKQVIYLMTRKNKNLQERETKKFFFEHLSYFMTNYAFNNRELFINEYRDVKSSLLKFIINSYKNFNNNHDEQKQTNNEIDVIRVYLRKYAECYTLKKTITDKFSYSQLNTENINNDLVINIIKEYKLINSIDDIMKVSILSNENNALEFNIQ